VLDVLVEELFELSGEIVVFGAVLLLGLAYVWRKGL
jgi:hypothetical protein